jgi:hypothetical protein
MPLSCPRFQVASSPLDNLSPTAIASSLYRRRSRENVEWGTADRTAPLPPLASCTRRRRILLNTTRCWKRRRKVSGWRSRQCWLNNIRHCGNHRTSDRQWHDQSSHVRLALPLPLPRRFLSSPLPQLRLAPALLDLQCLLLYSLRRYLAAWPSSRAHHFHRRRPPPPTLVHHTAKPATAAGRGAGVMSWRKTRGGILKTMAAINSIARPVVPPSPGTDSPVSDVTRTLQRIRFNS